MPTDAVIRLPSGAQLVASVSPVSSEKSSAPGVLVSLRDAVRVEALERQVRSNVHSLGHVARKRLSDIIGSSDLLRRTVATAQAFAAVDATVLILGNPERARKSMLKPFTTHRPGGTGLCSAELRGPPRDSLGKRSLRICRRSVHRSDERRKAGACSRWRTKARSFLMRSASFPRLQGKLLRVLQERQVRRVGGESHSDRCSHPCGQQ